MSEEVPSGAWSLKCLRCDWVRSTLPNNYNRNDPAGELMTRWVEHAKTAHYEGWSENSVHERTLMDTELTRGRERRRDAREDPSIPSPSSWPEERLFEVAEAYKEGVLSVNEICKKFRASRSVVRHARKVYGIPSRKELQQEERERRNRIIRIMLEEGLAPADISARTGMSLHLVYEVRTKLKRR